MEKRLRFSQRHPFLFGVILIIMAVALVTGAMALFRSAESGAFAGERLGELRVDGVIMDSADMVEFARKLREDDTVKGVLLRVNTPGGAVAPSQELYQAVRSLAEVKPVVASFSTVAASGGYYASAPATKIYANPGSLTASIGVKVEFVTLRDALEKLGITPEVLTTGRFKASGTPLKELDPAQRQQLQSVIDDLHDQFVEDVARARGMKREQVASIADGRAVTGRQAMAYGLVDALGSRENAIRELKRLAGLEGPVPLESGPKVEEPLLKELLGVNLSFDSLLSGWKISY
ncbi:signal peptide peptidase SppA [Desulfovibrio oxyclinae]|uniref:signal peptide peptidase SppA n=1 Tax=Desulfovibrio oxyclinae TaxID=63560 RepID=UPI0003752DA1|nr:signal peptide peptidase SppA [Desulfovibrio oxyclinae]